MEIKRIGSQPSSKGPADWFTGTVRIDPRARQAPVSLSNQALEQRGTPIRWVRP